MLVAALWAAPMRAAAEEPMGILGALIQRLSQVAERAVTQARETSGEAEALPRASAAELEQARRAALARDLPDPTEPCLHRSDLEKLPRALLSLVGRGLDVREHPGGDHDLLLQLRPRGNGARLRLSVRF